MLFPSHGKNTFIPKSHPIFMQKKMSNNTDIVQQNHPIKVEKYSLK